ncbi:hypothetical protein BJ986_002233 [Phycicoccus badiiscoriae]|uniref:Uncharacterized protein n=1 Tax=Pedococcus badiiscoriae TaxID=642776 RepID=A0A852WR18_9MICO|nr:hypothetical protein [Pedococcus badiiscoriae]NYG07746.1 hypothetical protein [Pedococcus badiiscoriae]
MTLRSTIQELRAHADVANDEHQVKVRTGHFADLSARLSPPLSELPALNIGLAEIAQLGAEMPPSGYQDAAQIVEGLRALAKEVPTLGIDENLDLAKARVRSAEKYVSDLRALVTSSWQSFVNQPPPAINTGLVDALARSGVDVEEIRDALETARSNLLAISSRMIPGRGAVEQFRAAIEAIHRCGEKLGEVVDADIAQGVVGSQEPSGIPLTWFTPERLDKLADLGIIDRFRVRLQ